MIVLELGTSSLKLQEKKLKISETFPENFSYFMYKIYVFSANQTGESCCNVPHSQTCFIFLVWKLNRLRIKVENCNSGGQNDDSAMYKVGE